MRHSLSFAAELTRDRERMLAAYRVPVQQAQGLLLQGGSLFAQTMQANMLHGTTIAAFLVNNDKTAIAVTDGKATISHEIASLDYRKGFLLDTHTVILIAGSVVMGVEMARGMRAYIRSYQDLRMGRPMSTDAKKKHLSHELLRNMGLIASGMILAPLLVTYDRERGMPRLYRFVPDGSFIARPDYATGGSGSDVYKVINERRRVDMSVPEGVKLARYLIQNSGSNDAMSGGETFVFVVNQDGARLLTAAEEE